MFKMNQRVWCTLYGWATVYQLTAGGAHIRFDNGDINWVREDGKYSPQQNQCAFAGKPIISGYEPPPFEGKLKKGDQVVMRARHGTSSSGIVTVGSDLRDEVVTEFGTVYQKGLYNVYRIVEEPVY